MTLSLNSLRPEKQKNKKSRRVGRGDASGRGTYSGRGLKGQKARSGSTGLVLIGIKDKIQQVPKKRGFKSLKDKEQIIKTDALNKNFKEGDLVTPEKLRNLGLIAKINLPVKILAGRQDLKVKKLILKDIKASKKILEQLENLGGRIKN